MDDPVEVRPTEARRTMARPSGKPRRVLHPRDLVCPRCGAGVDRPCSFSGRVQEEVHCTERLLALGGPDLRVEAAPASRPAKKSTAPGRPRKKRPLPPAPTRRKPAAAVEDDAPLTLSD